MWVVRTGILPLLVAPRHAREARRACMSVSGTIYSDDAGGPVVQLFTKSGCTLCDVAKEVLASAAEREPHTLQAVDITDADRQQWWRRYKYDIPVLHIDGKYWAKHKITLDEAIGALGEARAGRWDAQPGEPDAEKLERRERPAGGEPGL